MFSTRTINTLPKLRKMSSSQTTKYFLLKYDYIDKVLEKRTPFRTDHLQLANKYVDAGKIVLGGAFADPVDGAAVVFKAEGKSEVEEFARNDPYVINGIVTKWEVREWTVVVGKDV